MRGIESDIGRIAHAVRDSRSDREMSVQDLQGWWSRIDDAGFRSRHSMRAEAPQDRPWGLRDMVLIDPSGVLWRIAQAAAPG